jgi:hypothetical protein
MQEPKLNSASPPFSPPLAGTKRRRRLQVITSKLRSWVSIHPFHPIIQLPHEHPHCLIDFLCRSETRTEVLVEVNIKVKVFWDVTPYIMVDTGHCFEETCCLSPKDWRKPKSMGSSFLRKVGTHFPRYTASQPWGASAEIDAPCVCPSVCMALEKNRWKHVREIWYWGVFYKIRRYNSK